MLWWLPRENKEKVKQKNCESTKHSDSDQEPKKS